MVVFAGLLDLEGDLDEGIEGQDPPLLVDCEREGRRDQVTSRSKKLRRSHSLLKKVIL